jgi:hypothetical protein
LLRKAARQGSWCRFHLQKKIQSSTVLGSLLQLWPDCDFSKNLFTEIFTEIRRVLHISFYLVTALVEVPMHASGTSPRNRKELKTMDAADKTKLELPALAYSPDDIPKLTSGQIPRRRVFTDMASGKLRAKKAGRRTIITPEDAKTYISSFPDRPTKLAARDK